jgi:hypothetical protein
MTRLEIRSLIRKRLGETTASFWSDAELNSWINDACTDVAFRAKCLRGSSYFTTVADTADYTMSALVSAATVLSINEVYYKQNGTTWQKLEATSRTELDMTDPTWKSTDSGTPQRYWFDREEGTFSLYQKPDSTNAGVSYGQLFYTKAHVDINGDSESPQLPEYIQNAIVDYVVANGYEQRGWGDKANDAWTKYYSKIRDYQVERNREKEDEDIVSKNYRNL